MGYRSASSLSLEIPFRISPRKLLAVVISSRLVVSLWERHWRRARTITARTDVQDSPVPAAAKARAAGTDPGTPSGRLDGENQNHLNVSRHNRLSNGTGCSSNCKG